MNAEHSDHAVDIVVVGGGMAGLTAGLFCIREGLSTVVVDRLGGGGQLLMIPSVDNVPGVQIGTPGAELAATLLMQAIQSGVQVEAGDVVGLKQTEGIWLVKLGDGGKYMSAAVILATGSTLRRLGVPGEDPLYGKGVTYCGSCDGWFFRDKSVVVVGGGDSALDETVHLAPIVNDITLVYRESKPHGARTTLKRVESLPNVSSHPNSEVVQILGAESVTGVKVKDRRSDATTVLPAEGVAIYSGLEPNSRLLDGMGVTSKEGRVRANERLEVARGGLFTAGDVRVGSSRKLVGCASDGAFAAQSVARYLGRSLDC